MRKESDGSRLTPDNVFSLNRADDADNLEKGLSATLGFDYELTNKDKEFQLSLGQIVSQKENKKSN